MSKTGAPPIPWTRYIVVERVVAEVGKPVEVHATATVEHMELLPGDMVALYLLHGCRAPEAV